MDDTLDDLLKNGQGKKKSSEKASKKIHETKKRLNKICGSLVIDSKFYLPEETVATVADYVNEVNKVDRILYSEISAYIISLDEESRGTFSTNIDKLLLHVLDPSNLINDDVRKICIKIYDHFQLNLTQIESASTITHSELAKAMSKEKTILREEVKGIEKEYITILGIFAAIMLAFVGSFTFSTSVLNNISDTDTFTLILVSLVIGLVFVILITVLIDFLREINNKVYSDNADTSKKQKNNPISKNVIILLAILIGGIVLGNAISQIKLPEIVYIGVEADSNSQAEGDNK